MSNNKGIKDGLKGITLTMIFEASALNRDEKLGGNIPSIKKLTRFGNKTFSYLSRVAMRHYLFETLSKRFPESWLLTPTYESGSGNNKVVQFDLKQANILTHAELDAFGYMFTIGGQASITRKAAVGITKAIALETWEGDMQFNANHDLASRCGANPNPVNKEEQQSYFKASFTIDVEKMGNDEWWIKNNKYDDVTKKLTFSLSENETDDAVLENVERGQKEENVNFTIKIENDIIGQIGIKSEGSNKKAIFALNTSVKMERIRQILDVLKNGLIYHSSGENYGIVPKFIIAGGLGLPLPLFNSFVDLGSFEKSILDNGYILKDNDQQKLVYVYNPKNLVGEIDTSNLYSDWNKFLEALEVNKNGEKNSEDQNPST